MSYALTSVLKHCALQRLSSQSDRGYARLKFRQKCKSEAVGCAQAGKLSLQCGSLQGRLTAASAAGARTAGQAQDVSRLHVVHLIIDELQHDRCGAVGHQQVAGGHLHPRLFSDLVPHLACTATVLGASLEGISPQAMSKQVSSSKYVQGVHTPLSRTMKLTFTGSSDGRRSMMRVYAGCAMLKLPAFGHGRACLDAGAVWVCRLPTADLLVASAHIQANHTPSF